MQFKECIFELNYSLKIFEQDKNAHQNKSLSRCKATQPFWLLHTSWLVPLGHGYLTLLLFKIWSGMKIRHRKLFLPLWKKYLIQSNTPDWINLWIEFPMKEDLRMTFFGLSSLLSVAHTLAYSSMRNEEWGIWKQGISREENWREKWENARPKIKHLGSFWRRKW